MRRFHSSVKRIVLALFTLAVLYFGLGALLHHVVLPEEEPPDWAYAPSGFSFETPTGEKFRVVRPGRETGGEFAQSEFHLLPGGMSSRGRAHVHPYQEERFQILEGSVVAVVNGEEKVVSAGETLVIPPGTSHLLLNRGHLEMRSLAEVRPAGKLGLFFGQMAGLDFKPSFLQMMLFFQEYHVYPASPPPVILRTLSFLLAPTARLFGYRSFYPEYAERFLKSAAQPAHAADREQPS
jgi:quercetin dioxygenase-like cupin family protein